MLHSLVDFVVGRHFLVRRCRRRTGGSATGTLAGRLGDRRSGVAGRLVGKCAGYAGGILVFAIDGFLRLLAADGLFFRRRIRTIAFRCLLGFGKIQQCGHFGLDVFLAGDRFENGFDALHVAMLDIAQIVQLAWVQPAGVVCVDTAAEQIAVLVNHGNVLHRQIRHAARYQMHDAGNLPAIEHAPGMQGKNHRGGWFLLFAQEHRGTWNGQMHARRFDRCQRLDRFGQFTFHRALVIHLLGKLADTELLIVHQLETDGAAFRQSLRSQTQTDIVDLLGRYADHPAGFQLVLDIHLLQRLGYGTAILVGQIAEQDFIGGGRSP